VPDGRRWEQRCEPHERKDSPAQPNPKIGLLRHRQPRSQLTREVLRLKQLRSNEPKDDKHTSTMMILMMMMMMMMTTMMMTTMMMMMRMMMMRMMMMMMMMTY
jgi:hypothetical protein